MKLSYNWLNDFIDLSDLKISDLANLLTMKTCEVEEYFELRPDLEKFLVAEVKKVEPHPDADKLRICQVFDGTKNIQIVTGAPNVEQGKKYPLAPVGVIMPGGLEIKPAKLRGVDSYGMLCSAEELELENFVFSLDKKDDGLLTLPDTMKTGSVIRNVFFLNDFILDIDNKSITHRPDLWSHFGVARELASLTGKPLKKLPESKISENSEVDNRTKKVSCKIESAKNAHAAIAYSWVNLENIVIQPSDIGIQARLIAAGMRPINNVVDISNYVMLEIGQPNHAFDREKIGNKIGIDFAKGNEKLRLLDGRDISIPESVIIINDGDRPVALGGVMGGEDTEVSLKTKTLFLESATFYRKDIRKAVSSTGIRSEASQRFEKGQNPENSLRAISRFADLLQASCPDLSMGKIEHIASEKFKTNTIHTSISYLLKRLGNVKIDSIKIMEVLNSLGMQCTLQGDDLEVAVPVYRSYFDIEIQEDLVEEIGRIIGYNQIQPAPLLVSCQVPDYHNGLREFEHQLRNWMTMSYQFTEVFNYAFQGEEDIIADQRFSKTAIKLKNPVNKELEFMRISPLPGLLKNLASNFKEYSRLRFFEMERIFIPRNGRHDENSLPHEKYFLAGVMLAENSPDEDMTTFLTMVTDILVKSGFRYYEQIRQPAQQPVFHPGRGGQIRFRDTQANEYVLANWGEIHPQIVKRYQITKKVFYFEIILDDILQWRLKFSEKSESNYVPVYKYPGSEFEFTVVTDIKTTFATILNAVGIPKYRDRSTMNSDTLLESVEHLTTYTGESLPSGKKAVSIRVRWQNAARTLLHDEIKNLQETLIQNLAKSGFSLR